MPRISSVEVMGGGGDIGAAREGQSFHHCHTCGWQYPNHRPSAKKRRAHKKHCGKVAVFGTVKGSVEYSFLDSSDQVADAEKVDDVSSEYDSPDGILERNGEELGNMESSNGENCYSSLCSETPDRGDGCIKDQDDGKEEAMQSEQEESAASVVPTGKYSDEGRSFRSLSCDVIPNGGEVFKRTEPLSPGSVLDDPEIKIRKVLSSTSASMSPFATIDAISGHSIGTSTVLKEEVQVINGHQSKETYADNGAPVSSHEASNMYDLPDIRTISPKIQTENGEVQVINGHQSKQIYTANDAPVSSHEASNMHDLPDIGTISPKVQSENGEVHVINNHQSKETFAANNAPVSSHEASSMHDLSEIRTISPKIQAESGEVQVINGHQSEETYAANDAPVSSHEASSMHDVPEIRTISPKIQTENGENSNRQVLKDDGEISVTPISERGMEIHAPSKSSDLEAIIEIEMQQRHSLPNSQQRKESYGTNHVPTLLEASQAINRNEFESSPPIPILKSRVEHISPEIQTEIVECLKHQVAKSKGEIDEVPISQCEMKIHTSLKNLLEESIEIETEEESLLSDGHHQVHECDDGPRIRATFSALIYEESHQAERRDMQKEWNSPARFPQTRKDIKGRPKWKIRWVPFFCCPSGKSVSVT